MNNKTDKTGDLFDELNEAESQLHRLDSLTNRLWGVLNDAVPRELAEISEEIHLCHERLRKHVHDDVNRRLREAQKNSGELLKSLLDRAERA